MRPAYRASQFLKAIAAVPDQSGIKLAESILSPALMNLFLKMHPSEIEHSLKIVRKLKAAGETHPDLLAAALLHDVGKSRSPLKSWERVAVVLAQTFLQGKSQQWGDSDELHSWKRIFVVAQKHPDWGAEMAAAAGASQLTVHLIRRHQDAIQPVSMQEVESTSRTLGDFLLFRLQQADNES